MHVVVRAVIDIVDVFVVTKVVVVGVVLVLVAGGVDVTAVVVEGRRVDVGIVVDPPPDSGSSIWKMTSDVGVGDVAVLVVNGIVVGVAVVLVVDVVVACSGSSWTSATCRQILTDKSSQTNPHGIL